MPMADRDTVLTHTDLRELATELCGPPRGRGRSAAWHCPDPAHPDNNPSMGIFRARAGHDRWKCQSCGQGGTAIDLLTLVTGTTVGGAFRELAERLGLHGDSPTDRPQRPRPRSGDRLSAPVADAPDPAIELLVRRTAELLWQPIALGARTVLHRRGFSEPMLRANRVGFDPGPRHLPRPRGLPYRGPGIVFPALDPSDRHTVYYQLRYLNPARTGRKYDQPSVSRAPNPRFAELIPTGPVVPGYLVVAEGFPDGYTATQAGTRTVAVLGTSHADPSGAGTLADVLIERYPATAFAIYFDADHRIRPDHPPAGRIAAKLLADELTQRGAAAGRHEPPAPHKDLNDWWHADPQALTSHLTATGRLLTTGELDAASPPNGPPTEPAIGM